MVSCVRCINIAYSVLQVRLSGLREAYFGALFTSPQQHVHTMACTLDGGDCGGNDSVAVGLTHIVRFVESFETSERDLWLVRSPICLLALEIELKVTQPHQCASHHAGGQRWQNPLVTRHPFRRYLCRCSTMKAARCTRSCMATAQRQMTAVAALGGRTGSKRSWCPRAPGGGRCGRIARHAPHICPRTSGAAHEP